MDAVIDVETKADDHDSEISSPLQHLDSSTSSPLQRVDSVAGSPSENRADSLEYSTDDVSAKHHIHIGDEFSPDDGLIGVNTANNDGRSISSIDDENTYQTWHDKDRARDLFESAGSSLNTSLSSDNHLLSRYSRDLSFTPSRVTHVVQSGVDAMTSPVSPRLEPSGDDPSYRLQRPLLMFSPGLSPIHSKANVRTQDDRRSRATSIVDEGIADAHSSMISNGVPSRHGTPFNRDMVSKDGLIIIPVSSSIGNAPDTPISNFWRNRFFGGNDSKGRSSNYHSFDSTLSASKHSYSEAMRMSLLDDLSDTFNSSPSSADESFNTIDTDLYMDRQQSLVYPTTDSLYKASSPNNSTSSVHHRDTGASMTSAAVTGTRSYYIRAASRHDESVSTVDTDLRTNQKSLVYPTTSSLYKASYHTNNSSTASSIVNDKDPYSSRRPLGGVNRMLYASDDSFFTVDSEVKVGRDFLIHPTATALFDAPELANDSNFGTSDHDNSFTMQSLIDHRGDPNEEVNTTTNYSDLNATKISFLVPTTDLQQCNRGDFTLNSDNDDPHYSREVEESMQSMSFLPTHPSRSFDRSVLHHRLDRPPLTSRAIEASASRKAHSERGNYFSDSEVMRDSVSRGLLATTPTRPAAEATSLSHRAISSRPARSTPPIPPTALNKAKTPSKDYSLHQFTTPSPHIDVPPGSDEPSTHQTKQSSSPSWYSEASASLPIGSLYTLLSDSNGRPIFVPIMQSSIDGSMPQTTIKGIAVSHGAPRIERFSPHANPSLLDRFYYADDLLHRRTDGRDKAGNRSKNHSVLEDRYYLARTLEKAMNSSSAGSPTDHHRSDDLYTYTTTRSMRVTHSPPAVTHASGTPHSSSSSSNNSTKSPYRLGMSRDGKECLLPSSGYWKDRMAHRSMTSVVNSTTFLRMVT